MYLVSRGRWWQALEVAIHWVKPGNHFQKSKRDQFARIQIGVLMAHVKHAFISYVHEDEERADQLQDALEAAGVKVWRDKDDLPPGSDWANEIRKAITGGSLAFIACFSEASAGRDRSYQYEELTAAIDQFRQLPPSRQWLFPVRFDEVEMPEYSLGAGRTFDSIHRTDLFGKRRDSNLIRLTAAVAQLVGVPSAHPAGQPLERVTPLESPGSSVKRMLREPSLEIELDEFVMGVAADIRDGLSNGERFSPQSPAELSPGQWVDLIASRLNAYEEILKPLAEILVVASVWGEPKHEGLWKRAVSLVANVRQESGNTVLLALQDFIPIHLTYVSALASVARENYYCLTSILAIPVRRLHDRQPLIERLHTGILFETAWLGEAVLIRAEGKDMDDHLIERYRKGLESKRYTPVSDYLYTSIRSLFTSLVPDDQDFEDIFDQTELLLSLKAFIARIDALAGNRYAYGPWFGRFTWKMQYRNRQLLDEFVSTIVRHGTNWKPYQHGLLGLDQQQIEASLPNFEDEVKQAVSRRF